MYALSIEYVYVVGVELDMYNLLMVRAGEGDGGCEFCFARGDQCG